MGFFKSLRAVRRQAEALTDQAQEMVPPEQRVQGLGGLMGFAQESMGAISGALGDLGEQQQTAARVKAEGVATTASVTALAETGMFLGRSPICDIQLEVTPPGGGTPYAATVRQAVQLTAIPRFQPGCAVDVKVDPADPQAVAIG